MADEPAKEAPPKEDDAAKKAAAAKAAADADKVRLEEEEATRKRRNLGMWVTGAVFGLLGLFAGPVGAVIAFGVGMLLGNLLKDSGLFDGEWMKGIAEAVGI